MVAGPNSRTPGNRTLGIILAGGGSTRMGADKAGLAWQGTDFLSHAEALLTKAGCDQILVSGRPDLPNGIADTRPGEGPAVALLDLLTAQTHAFDTALVIPVDMPLLTAEDLQPLLAAPSRIYENHPLPLAIALTNGLPETVRRMKDFPAESEPVTTSLADRLRNINAPEDYQALLTKA